MLPRGALRALRPRGGPAPGRRDRGPLLASIPLEPAVGLGGDKGEPVALDPDGEAARAFAGLVEAIVERCPVLQMTSCSARVLDALGALERATAPVAPAG